MRLGLRGRLMAAFVLVGVPPLLLLAAVVTALVSASFERTAAARLEAALETARHRIDALRRRAERQVAAVATQDLPAASVPAGEERTLADALAQRRDLPALEIVDGAGRIVSSHHWPAGFGLEERDAVLAGDGALRLETVAEGYGAGERLALMPSHRALWRGAPVTVRGGPFLDGDFLGDLSGLMGLEVALRDVSRGRWIAPPASPLASWDGPALGSRSGGALLGGTAYRWAASPLGPTLSLVVATPRTPLDEVTGQVRRFTLAMALGSLLAALLAALVLSGRIARPVRELAAGARRVAGGDLEGSVAVTTGDEIGDLAGAFNAMTSELRASRERLLQVERVAAWREMARRLAHELKNPLFPIQLSIETLRRAFDEGRDFAGLFRESSDTILEELRSLRGIVDEFGDFARLPRPQFRPTDVNEVVEQVLGLYQARLGGVRLALDAAPGLPSVPADRDLLARALGNLVANAIEAMPEGGTLRVATRADPGGVAVEVADTGPGLSEEQRGRLFTPYFTTKPGGTGLGLAIVQGVVADHGGRVEVESAAGRGTAFTIVLPASGPAAVREKL